MSTTISRIHTGKLLSTINTELDFQIDTSYRLAIGEIKNNLADSPVEHERDLVEDVEDHVADVARDYLLELGIGPETTTPDNLGRLENLMRLVVLTAGMEA